MEKVYWLALLGECGKEISKCRQPSKRWVEDGTTFTFTELPSRPRHWAVFTKKTGGKQKNSGIIHDERGLFSGEFRLTISTGLYVSILD